MMFFVRALPTFLVASSVAAAIIPNSPVATKRGLSRRQVGDKQSSLQLDPTVIGANLASNGLVAGAEAGQVASLTSTNNFINFCLTTGLPNTNGQQVIDGSCNSVPMGVIVARARMPSCKFQFPPNLAVIPPNQQFTIQMAISNMASGNFVNPQTNYFGAPQQVNGQGIVIAHSHVVIETIDSLDSVAVPNPQNFAFFKGLNAAAQGGILSATVTGGLPAGTYKLSSINTAANHQPILGAVAQHGSYDDVVYFTVGAAPAAGGDGTAPATGGNAAGSPAVSSSVSATASSTQSPVASPPPSATGSPAASPPPSTTSAPPAASTPATPPVSSTPAASPTPSAGGNTGSNGRGNLQKFIQALGGVKPPPVTQVGRFFGVSGNSQNFTNLRSALERSCNVQNNECANAANSRRFGRPQFTVGDCSSQRRLCLALLPK